MNVFKTKWFKKWAAKNSISSEKLLDAIDNIDKNLGTVDLGSNVYKARISKGKGKRSGYRTIIIYKKDFRCLFVYGFEKSDKDNIPENQLSDFKKYSQVFLNYLESDLKNMLDEGFIFPLEAP